MSGGKLPCFWEDVKRGKWQGFESWEFNWLELVKKKIEISVAAVVGRNSPVVSADYLRALSEVSPQKVPAERLMANMLHSLKNQQTLWMFTQAGK